MNESRVEALLRNDPIPGLPEEVRAAHKQALRAAIAGDPATPPTPAPAPGRRRWWRRGGITLLAGGLVLAGAGAATAFLTRAQPDDPEIVRCFSVAAPPFTSGAPGSYDASYGPGDGTLDQSAALAIELCGYGWAEGRLPWPETKDPGYTQPRTPHLCPSCRPASSRTASSGCSPATRAPAPNSACPDPRPDPAMGCGIRSIGADQRSPTRPVTPPIGAHATRKCSGARRSDAADAVDGRVPTLALERAPGPCFRDVSAGVWTIAADPDM